MKKIEWNMVTGVYEVESFDCEATQIEGFEIEDLKEEFEGTRAAIISDAVFHQVKAEYGIS
jgi:hypothetical protein